QFYARWGERPLVDNWRVARLIINKVESDSLNVASQIEGVVQKGNEIIITIDLSRVPFTPAEQDSVREEIAYLNYELANLFFLSLNLPDSAQYYFNKVLTDRPKSKVAPVSLYS